MKTLKFALTAVLLAAALAACATGSSGVETTVPQQDPTLDQAQMDSAVQATVAAELTRLADENPSSTPVSVAPTFTPVPPTPTNAPLPSDTPEPTPTTSELALDDQALFLADVTIPDGSEIIAGEAFTKTWRLQNIGLNAWTTDYGFVFVNGELMEGFPIFLPEEVPPGGSIEISIPMIAPFTGGVYEGFWMLANPDGAVFGAGDEANLAFLVSIVVIEPTAEPTETSTPEPTATP